MDVRLENGENWEPQEFLAALRDGRVTALTPVSFDYGKTWTTAAAAAKRIEQKRMGTEVLSAGVPKGWDLYAAYALWLGLFWGLFFTLPTGLLAGLYASRDYGSSSKRVAWVVGALITGVLPMIAMGLIARWGVRRSGRRGAGVAWFCFAIAALSVLEMLVIPRF